MTARIAASVFMLLASVVPALAQAPLVHANPTPGCSVTPAQLEANRKVAMEFFRPGITGEQRLALVDPSYIQHNAALKKAARDQGVSDYDAFRNAFARGGGAGRAGGGGRPGGPGGQAAGPQPPPGNDLEIVTAECDIVTIVRKLVRQDPTAAPGTFYETFAFDTFRVRNGKLVEHWDAAVINPPAAAPGGAGAPGGGAPGGRGGQ